MSVWIKRFSIKALLKARPPKGQVAEIEHEHQEGRPRHPGVVGWRFGGRGEEGPRSVRSKTSTTPCLYTRGLERSTGSRGQATESTRCRPAR